LYLLGQPDTFLAQARGRRAPAALGIHDRRPHLQGHGAGDPDRAGPRLRAVKSLSDAIHRNVFNNSYDRVYI
jgi:hypothetical protein